MKPPGVGFSEKTLRAMWTHAAFYSDRAKSRTAKNPADFAVQGGQYGRYPSLNGTTEDDNALELIHDFRDLFGTVAVRWLNFPQSQLLGANPLLYLFQPTTPTDSLGKNYTGFASIDFLAP